MTATTITASVTIDDHTYTATVTGDRVSIDRDGEWAGDGVYRDGRIDDCSADLPEEAYEALEQLIAPV